MNVINMPEIRNEEGFSIIRFNGYVDASITEQARLAITRRMPPGCKIIIVDLTGVEFLDSHGIGLFVSLLKKVHPEGGRLYFAGAEGQPASVLDMVGFNGTLVTYCATPQQALEMMRKQT